MRATLIGLLVACVLVLFYVMYQVYVVMYVPSENQIKSTTNTFNRMHQKSDYDKSVLYHTLDNN